MREHSTESPPTVQANQIVSEQGLARIFEGVKVAKLTRAGLVDHYRVRGFHLENAAVMAAHGYTANENTRTSPDRHGVYRVGVQMYGKRRNIGSGFFPREWTREQVINAISEALTNKEPYQWGEFERCYIGRTQAGMRIVMELDDAGLVLDAFPLRRPCKAKTEALWRVQTGRQRRSKFVCSECGRLKSLCCPAGCDSPPPLYKRLPKKARRLFMRAVRAVARRL